MNDTFCGRKHMRILKQLMDLKWHDTASQFSFEYKLTYSDAYSDIYSFTL